MIRFASLNRFLAAEDGATAIEYGLIAALVSVAAIGALGALGDSLDSLFTTVSDSVNGVIPEDAGE
jgi:pilus assembly protein Flp/PilA